MIYFSLKEIFQAVFAFIILGIFASFFYFFLSFMKKESILTFVSLKKLLLSSPKDYKKTISENKPTSLTPPGHFFEFAYTLFIGILFILISYVFADGLFRLAYLFFFIISFVLTNKLLSRIEEPLLSTIAKVVAKFLYILLLIVYPIRCVALAVFKLIFGIIQKVFKFFIKNIKKMLIKVVFSKN